MKKTLFILALILALALSVLGLAAETALETENESTAAAPLYGQYGRRYRQAFDQPGAQGQPAVPFGMGRGWGGNQAPVPGQTSPAGRLGPNMAGTYGFTDENQDGVCDNCGYIDENWDGVCDACGGAQGTNAQAPFYMDQNQDGVCDNLGTAQQYQGRTGRGRNRR